MIWRKAGVNVPSRVARIVGVRKSDREPAQAFSGNPAPRTNQPIEGLVQCGRVRSLTKGFLRAVADAHHGAGPCGGIIRRTAGFFPEDDKSSPGDRSGKGVVQSDVAVVKELVLLGGTHGCMIARRGKIRLRTEVAGVTGVLVGRARLSIWRRVGRG